MSVGPVIRRAGPVDAGRLGAAGPAIYAESYAFLWDDDAAYAAQLATFGPDAFADLLARDDARVWLVEDDGALLGFLSLLLGVPEPVTGRSAGAEVPRIYLARAATGQGLGRRMLDEAAACARDEGAGYLWLDAMETAHWAVRTYQKWGFAEIGRMPFSRPVKAGHGTLVVLSRDL